MPKFAIQDRELEVTLWDMSEDKSVSGKREKESVGQNEIFAWWVLALISWKNGKVS